MHFVISLSLWSFRFQQNKTKSGRNFCEPSTTAKASKAKSIHHCFLYYCTSEEPTKGDSTN